MPKTADAFSGILAIKIIFERQDSDIGMTNVIHDIQHSTNLFHVSVFCCGGFLWINNGSLIL